MTSSQNTPRRKDPIEAVDETGLISAEELEAARERQQSSGTEVAEALTEPGVATAENLARMLSLRLNIPLIDLKRHKSQPQALELIPAELARKHKIVPLDVINDALLLVMADPEDVQAMTAVANHTRMKIVPTMAIPQEVQRAIELNYGLKGEIEEQMQGGTPKTSTEVQQAIGPKDKLSREIAEQLRRLTPKTYGEEAKAETLMRAVAEAPIVRAVDLLVRQAVEDRASDIHIEPQKDRLRIRYRIDGILHDVASVPLDFHVPVVSRIKVLAQMDIAERRRPQDGQFSYDVDGKQIDIRVATFNTIYGEMGVLRILDKSLPMFALSHLGLLPQALERYQQMLKSPLGMIVVAGPTGAGKTTSLYASLNQLDHDERKIITVEDPVEYQFSDISPSEINPKADITFASGLRAIMRLDPDVILVGEIRDAETANTAVQAALTGHLVLSSIHANDAAGVIFRLLHLGIEPFLLSSALIGIVAQRMVRRVCPDCSVLTEAKAEEKIAYQQEINEMLTQFHYGAGCNNCAGTGYRGRTGVFEVLSITEEIRKLILSGASTDELRAQAIKEGMMNMRHDGMLKVKEGITTPHEVLRNVFSIDSSGRSEQNESIDGKVRVEEAGETIESPEVLDHVLTIGSNGERDQSGNIDGKPRVQEAGETIESPEVLDHVLTIGSNGERDQSGNIDGKQRVQEAGETIESPEVLDHVLTIGSNGERDQSGNIDGKQRVQEAGETIESPLPGSHSLETYVRDYMPDTAAELFPIHVRNLPELVWATILHLRGKHPKLGSTTQVTRALIEVGLPVLAETMEGVPTLKSLMERAYLEGEERQREELLESQFEVRLSVTKFNKTAYCTSRETLFRLNELVDDLGLGRPTMATLALMAGMAQSILWVPDKHRNRALEELREFKKWVERRKII